MKNPTCYLLNKYNNFTFRYDNSMCDLFGGFKIDYQVDIPLKEFQDFFIKKDPDSGLKIRPQGYPSDVEIKHDTYFRSLVLVFFAHTFQIKSKKVEEALMIPDHFEYESSKVLLNQYNEFDFFTAHRVINTLLENKSISGIIKEFSSKKRPNDYEMISNFRQK